jgi:hypothetical protein
MRIDVHTRFMSEQVARTLEKRSHFPYTRFVDGTPTTFTVARA